MIKVRILTPEWSREFETDAIFLPGELGEFEVLVNHAPIISLLNPGNIRWRTVDEKGVTSEESLSVNGGVVRVNENHLQICVEI